MHSLGRKEPTRPQAGVPTLQSSLGPSGMPTRPHSVPAQVSPGPGPAGVIHSLQISAASHSRRLLHAFCKVRRSRGRGTMTFGSADRLLWACGSALQGLLHIGHRPGRQSSHFLSHFMARDWPQRGPGRFQAVSVSPAQHVPGKQVSWVSHGQTGNADRKRGVLRPPSGRCATCSPASPSTTPCSDTC